VYNFFFSLKSVVTIFYLTGYQFGYRGLEELTKILDVKFIVTFLLRIVLNFGAFLYLHLQFILEQLCNLICPSKPEPVYLLVLNKAHTQEEFIRGSMTKNPYSSTEIGPLMRDVKNKICHQLDLLGLLEDDYGMELLVAGNIISLDLSIAHVFELVWKKSNQSSNATNSNLVSSNAVTSSRYCPPMTVTYRLQVCFSISGHVNRLIRLNIWF
jgi:hypothetical protein